MNETANDMVKYAMQKNKKSFRNEALKFNNLLTIYRKNTFDSPLSIQENSAYW